MSTNPLEVMVEADNDVKFFREAGSWVGLFLPWYLDEVKLVSWDCIWFFAWITHLRYVGECSSKGAEVKNLPRRGPALNEFLIGT